MTVVSTVATATDEFVDQVGALDKAPAFCGRSEYKRPKFCASDCRRGPVGRLLGSQVLTLSAICRK
jgi:hypothetical protein